MKAQVIIVATLIAVVAVGAALGATIERVGPGGLWSTVNQWDPNQLRTSSDTAVHGTDANDVKTFDAAVPANRRTIDAFTAVAGGDRGLIIDEELTLPVENNFTRSSGSGAYVTQLLQDSTPIVDGTNIRGDWIVGSGALVEAGAVSLGADTDWEIDGGELHVLGNVSTDANFNNVIVESGASVDLTDENENILRGNSSLYTQDALYVDGDVTVQSSVSKTGMAAASLSC